MRRQITKIQAEVLEDIGMPVLYYVVIDEKTLVHAPRTQPGLRQPRIYTHYLLCLTTSKWSGELTSFSYRVYQCVRGYLKNNLNNSATRAVLVKHIMVTVDCSFEKANATISELLHRKKVLAVAPDKE